MFAVHFYENKTRVFTQALRNIPSIDEGLKIKGRKGKVISVEQVADNIFHVQVEFEKIVEKNLTSSKELGKKKKR